MIDETHAPQRQSWIASANSHPDFPIQNLPIGIFSRDGDSPRAGIAIGDEIFDLAAAWHLGLFAGAAAQAAEACNASTLNDFFALGKGPRQALRHRLSALLDAASTERSNLAAHRERLVHAASACTLHLPAQIGDYTDFYAGIHHATNVGRLFGRNDPLPPNYKYVPIGYHGRASSVQISGSDIRRPSGQRKPGQETVPSFGPSRNLDYELELGIWIGPGNDLGNPIPIGAAADHIAGFCLLNDWSARDIQAWEYQPLGPFLAKSFATTISPWVIMPEALAPFRRAQALRAEGDPAPLPHLFDARDQADGGLDIALDVHLVTDRLKAEGKPPHRLSRGNAIHLYWTPAQFVAHHTSNGCNLRPGDLFGSGTISSPDRDGFGSLLEITEGGRKPITLGDDETRRFLEDGDEVVMTARCRREGFASIGFGTCRGRIVASR
jgi:fumarylacetoacetase